MPNFNAYGGLFGGAGSPFGGSTGSWASLLGHHNPFNPSRPAGDPGEPFTLREEDQGRPALSFYASQPGLTTPFTDWRTSPLTHTRLWDDYLAQAADRGGGYFFQDYLAQNDPRLRWMQLAPEDRGETPQSAYALPSHFNARQ